MHAQQVNTGAPHFEERIFIVSKSFLALVKPPERPSGEFTRDLHEFEAEILSLSDIEEVVFESKVCIFFFLF